MLTRPLVHQCTMILHVSPSHNAGSTSCTINRRGRSKGCVASCLHCWYPAPNIYQMLTLGYIQGTDKPENGITVIIGHTNSDLDCFGSMILARLLYPGAILVRSALVHPVARNLHHLYGNRMGMVYVDELDPSRIERIVIVDTRTKNRIDEYFSNLEEFAGEIIVYDHHAGDEGTIPASTLHKFECGANTTLVGLEVRSRGISPDEDEATIALTGIYADTGNFLHSNVCEEDFSVAAWLRACGASIRLVRNFLRSLSDQAQISLFREVVNSRTYHEIQGHFIVLAEMHIDGQMGGLAAVAEKLHEVESPDATFVVFGLKKEKSVLIVGRSQRESIFVNKVLAAFGGGGHEFAASAYIKGAEASEIRKLLFEKLSNDLIPACSAQDVMLFPAHSIRQDWTLLEASIFLERINQSGAAVVDAEGQLTGVLTLRDIMKGRKHAQMHAPVSAYMSRKVISVGMTTPMRRIEQLVHENNIAYLPVTENGRVIGIVTRDEVIDFIREQSRRERIIVENARAVAIDFEEKGDEHAARPDL